MPPSLPPQAQAALQAGRKIAAIRIVRDSMGVSLAEAKALVDAAVHQGGVVAADARSPHADLLMRALEALRQGRLIDGVRILRQSGLGLAEAKALLEQAQREDHGAAGARLTRHPVPPASLPLRAMLALREGKLVDAVREYRQQHGTGLKAARDALEAHLAEDPLLRRQYEDARARRREPVKRLLGIAVVLLLLVGAWLAWRTAG